MLKFSRPGSQATRRVLLALLAGFGFAILYGGSPQLANLYVAVIATLLAAGALAMWGRLDRLLSAEGLPRVTLAIASDAAALSLFQVFGEAMRETIATADPIYHQLAMERFRRLVDESKNIAAGRIEFIGTEAWRAAYEQLLRSRGLYHYRSVAYLRTPNYWQDEPGRQSMRLNFEMAQSGLMIERVVILPDSFWPNGETDPVEPVGRWVDEQHRRGVRVMLVRESLLDAERDLLADFGLYGNRAVGFQQIDDHGRTVRFTLSFDFAELMAAERRWERLMVYAAEFGK